MKQSGTPIANIRRTTFCRSFADDRIVSDHDILGSSKESMGRRNRRIVSAGRVEMSDMLDHSCQVQRSPLNERGDDLYETPDVAVHALMRAEKLPHHIWEP